MGFPFTGSVAVLRIMELVTGKSMASNDGRYMTDANGYLHKRQYDSKSIDPVIFPNGPFIQNIDLPTDAPAMLVETQCSGYCFNCAVGPKYADLHNFASWARGCRTAHSFNAQIDEGFDLPPYSLHQRLGKAVLLVRNPMPTIVARFRDEASRDTYYEDNGLVNRLGLLEWCSKVDAEALSQDAFKVMVVDASAGYLPERVPCFSEFLRMTAWYNQAMKLLEGMDFHIVRFEELVTDLPDVVDGLISFTGIPAVNPVDESLFKRQDGKYAWFEDKEIIAIGELIAKVAHKKTWYLLLQHFRGLVEAADED